MTNLECKASLSQIELCHRCADAYCMSCEPFALRSCENGGLECDSCREDCLHCRRVVVEAALDDVDENVARYES
jgi:hypothetical protein